MKNKEFHFSICLATADVIASHSDGYQFSGLKFMQKLFFFIITPFPLWFHYPPLSFLLLFSSGRSYRAYKVAGITLLACVLIVGQVMTAYFLLTQKNEIKSLEEQSNKIKSDMTRGRSGEDGNNRLI